jgi:hypothetical protein
MAAVNRAAPFYVNGRKAYRIVGALVIVIGLLLFTGGQAMDRAGTMVKKRYEKASGKFIRNTSSVDRDYYHSTLSTIKTGKCLKIVSYFVLIIGILIVIKPHILFFELKRLGLEKDIS